MGRMQDVPGWRLFSERRLLSMVDAQYSGDSAVTYFKNDSGQQSAMSTIWLHFAGLLPGRVYFLFLCTFLSRSPSGSRFVAVGLEAYKPRRKVIGRRTELQPVKKQAPKLV